MRNKTTEIQDKILTFIHESAEDTSKVAGGGHRFSNLALDVFSYQFQKNEPYRKLAMLKGKTPLTVRSWKDIPLMPIQAFKAVDLTTVGSPEPEDVFYSSGTTNPENKSKHYLSDLTVWNASMKVGFQKFVMGNRDKMTIFSLFPGEEENPNSSLSRYIDTAIDFFGTPGSQSFVQNGKIDYDGFVQALESAIQKEEEILIIGASFSYVHLLDWLKEQKKNWQLPKGSFLFDTGGFKGKSKEVGMEDLYAAMEESLGVKRNQILNMYGMTEISSQCYDDAIIKANAGEAPSYLKQTPDWVHVLVLDPETMKPLLDGEKGILAYYDLSNWESCVGILTEDMAIKTEAGFQLLGRAKGAEAKGCSIALDELLKVK
ncbi:acyl-CoA synthetase [Fructobacillus sp. M2-14]|uniref:Acyl-CoA synthetase n=1 Tax=Fructobacillus broussonetiae TaxID=2713173 RepID=A0ABS5QY70_9LACO|nr:acyl-CoA synthetase [Fructobacillus broussonetiae]MBS9338151.1 acyl-CoA synthetase [Fructobacillus broussonetiae]